MAKKKKVTKKKVALKAVKNSKKAVGAKKAVQKPNKPAGQKVAQYRLNQGDRAPDFGGPMTSGENVSLASFKGKKLVLYFYPKDNTPGCTLEGYDFKKLYKNFQGLGCEVIGVSKDPLKAHEGFRGKCGFPFELLSDESGDVCKAFDVIQMKSLYGRKFAGIERSTFVLGEDGTILRAWRKVKVAGHADEVLSFVASSSRK